MAPWALSDAALVDDVESCARVACDSAALADAEELVLHLPHKPAAASAAKGSVVGDGGPGLRPAAGPENQATAALKDAPWKRARPRLRTRRGGACRSWPRVVDGPWSLPWALAFSSPMGAGD
eukprot:14367429-Alexandrium_andersonii.AAC.1